MSAKALLEDDVTLREFKAAEPGGSPSSDDRGCKELEKRSSMIPKHLKWLVDGHTIHKANFDFKIKSFPDGFIAVADSASEGIVGMICGAIKDVSMHWTTTEFPATKRSPSIKKAVYVFDLRVAQSHQKAGLGKRLIDYAHRRALDLGCNYAYLTVNGDNQKAQKLFLKCGYHECSERKPLGSKFGPSPKRSTSMDIRMEKVDGEQAANMLQTELSGHDFTPGDLQSLVKSKFYLGTFVATLGESSASISLWDGSAVTSFWISRFLFPAEWYGSPFFCYSLLGLGLAMGGAWLLHIQRVFAAGSIGWAVGYGIITAVVAFGVKKVSPMLDFIFMMMKNKDGDMKSRGRLWAPVQRGPKGSECLTAAIERAKSELMELGFLAWICNLDSESTLRSAFDAPSNFMAKLMHKSLEPAHEEDTLVRTSPNLRLPRTSPNDFHDPRDI